MPEYIVRILNYWYAHQMMRVKWGNNVSALLGLVTAWDKEGFCPQFCLIFISMSFLNAWMSVKLFISKHIVQHFILLICGVITEQSSLQKLQVAYNDAMRIFSRRPRWHSASEMFVSARVITFKALLRNLMYRFIYRLLKMVLLFIKYRGKYCISQSCGDICYIL